MVENIREKDPGFSLYKAPQISLDEWHDIIQEEADKIAQRKRKFRTLKCRIIKCWLKILRLTFVIQHFIVY